LNTSWSPRWCNGRCSMFERRNIVTMTFTAAQLSAVGFEEHVKAACVGGRSRIRAAGTARRATLQQDQRIGLLCNLAVCEFLMGTAQPWKYMRERADANPTAGDGGIDVPGIRVDVKGSAMRGSTDPMAYRLAVRPAERHERCTYVLCLVPIGVAPETVVLVGAATEDELPVEVERSGVFAGAFVLPAKRLRPIDQYRHRFRDVWERYDATGRDVA
jgi:hypothetical protein